MKSLNNFLFLVFVAIFATMIGCSGNGNPVATSQISEGSSDLPDQTPQSSVSVFVGSSEINLGDSTTITLQGSGGLVSVSTPFGSVVLADEAGIVDTTFIVSPDSTTDYLFVGDPGGQDQVTVRVIQPDDPVTTGILDIRTQPLNATIFVDGEENGWTPSQMSLSEGDHSVELVLAGYEVFDGNFTVFLDSTVEIFVNLVALPDTSRPTVSITGQDTVEANTLFDLNIMATGDEMLILHPGGINLPPNGQVYSTSITETTVFVATATKGAVSVSDTLRVVARQPVVDKKTYLQVTSSPTGATVWRNNLFFGLTNTDTIEVNPGIHELRVELDGHETVTTTVMLEEGDAKSVFVFLPEIAPKSFRDTTTAMVVRGDKGLSEQKASHQTPNEDGVYNVEVLVTLTGNQTGEHSYFYWDAYGVRYGQYLGDDLSPSDSSFYVHVGKHPVEPNQVFHLAHQNGNGGPESTHVDEIRGTESDDPNFWENLGSVQAWVNF